MPSAFIQDGFTLDGKVEARLPLYPEVRFTYRPALARSIYAARAQNARGKPEDELQSDAKMVAQHLVSWDVLGADGEVAPITLENIQRLAYPVLQVILAHIQGYAVTEEQADRKN